jgi:transmembrane protein TMEM43
VVDSFTESTPTGFLQEIGDSIKGVLAGVVILFVFSCCLFGNEWFYVQTKKALEGGLALTEEVPNDKVDSGKEGKLVLVNGTAKTEATLADSTFGIEVPAMRLARQVEMFQYEEKKKTTGKRKNKKTTYSYPKKWASKVIDSTNFNNKRKRHIVNPSTMEYDGESWKADEAKLGAFMLTPGHIAGFSLSQKISPGGDATPAASQAPSPAAADPLTCPICKKKLKTEAGVKDHMKAKHKGEAVPPAGGGGGATAANPKVPAGFKVTDGYLFKGKGSPGTPEIGDIRISWSYAPPSADVTVVGKQVGDSFAAYEINGINIADLHMGIQNKQEFYAQAQAANTMRLYMLRIFGTIMMIVGFGLIFAPLGAVTDIIPIFGDIVDLGTGCAAAGLGVVASFLMIALGWVFSRPLIGIPMLLLGIGGLVGLIILAKKMTGDKKAEGGAPAPAAPPAGDVPPPPAPPPAPAA